MDHLGTPMRAWERTTGVAAWAADHEAVGRAYEYLPSSSAAPDISIKLRFPGQYEDEETGLHYNWHRYYDPDTGRYLQPVLLSEEHYVYAKNRPCCVWDPMGLLPDGVGDCPPGWSRVSFPRIVASDEWTVYTTSGGKIIGQTTHTGAGCDGVWVCDKVQMRERQMYTSLYYWECEEVGFSCSKQKRPFYEETGGALTDWKDSVRWQEMNCQCRH